VEGGEWTVDPFRTEVGLNVSAAVLSFGAQRWGQVGGTIAWNAVGTALTWAAASEVTV